MTMVRTWRRSKHSFNKISSIKVRKLFHRTSAAHTRHAALYVCDLYLCRQNDSIHTIFDLVAACVWLEGKLLACNVINDLRHVLPTLLPVSIGFSSAGLRANSLFVRFQRPFLWFTR